MDKAKKNLIVFVLITAAAVIAIFYLAKSLGLFEKGADSSMSGEGSLAPGFSLKDEKGVTHSLSDYKGKYVIINFWGSWCTYCVSEMPDFQKASETFADAGDAVIISINDTSTERSLDDALNFIHLNNYRMLILFDIDGSVADLYDVRGYPTTYIIDENGYIYSYHIGALTEKDLYDIIEGLESDRNGT